MDGYYVNSRVFPSRNYRLICTGFVIRRFAGLEDVAKLNWFPVKENVELEILKLAHKSLYDEAFPKYLKLNLHQVSAYSLRSSIAPVLSIPRETATFQHSATTILISSLQLSEIIVITVLSVVVRRDTYYQILGAFNCIWKLYICKYSCFLWFFFFS